jgi:arylsulfatase A-like enzyme
LLRSLFLVVVIGSLAGCGGELPVVREAGLNVLLVTVDTLRADALGVYGSSRASTPVIDRLAAEGVRFSNARAHNVVTLPSHVNILSGLYPYHHGVRENAGFRVPKTVNTLATLLEARGYRTGAFVSAFPLDRRFGLDRGFDEYDDRYGKTGQNSAFRVPERPAVETVTAAKRWIDSSASSTPFFAWIHVYEPHFPYTPPEPFASKYRQTPYDGEVAAVDAALGSNRFSIAAPPPRVAVPRTRTRTRW